jgi:hypothetical protein
MSINMSPRARVAHAFQELFGPDFRVEIRGRHDTSGDHGRTYRVELLANEEFVAAATSKHRKIAYDRLKNKLEKLYAAGIGLV